MQELLNNLIKQLLKKTLLMKQYTRNKCLNAPTFTAGVTGPLAAGTTTELTVHPEGGLDEKD
jgi:hypothetical protein